MLAFKNKIKNDEGCDLMKNIEIKVSKKTRMVYLEKNIIGNDGENLQEKLVFSFKDEFVDGQARLEYEIDGEKYFAILTKVGESYEIPVKNVMTKEFQVNMQLVITEGADENEIPVFKSNVFYVFVNKSINAETEEPDGYAQWLDIANTKLNSIDEAILGVQEAVDYAREQGDYAKEQADNVTNASEEAIGIIRDFESDVEEYTTAFNENATNKTTDYNTNATNKVTEYNDNATEKLNAYNTNAELKLREYNENANSKVEEYNENADNRINDFNQNADSYLDAIVPKNDASGVPLYVDDAVKYRVLNLGAKGNYKQETTTGKQLFDKVSATTNQTKYVLNSDGTITNSNNWGVDGRNYFNSISLSAGTYTIGYIPSLSGSEKAVRFSLKDNTNSVDIVNTSLNITNGVQQSYTFTISETIDLLICIMPNQANSGAITLSDIQLVEGTYTSETMPPFEKFTGGQASPNPDFPSEIEVLEGYNLFDISTISENTFINVVGETGTSSVTNASDYIEIADCNSLSLSYNYDSLMNTSDRTIAYYDADKNFLGGINYNSVNKLISITPASDVHFIRFAYDKGVYDIQLVKGTQKPYLPYNNIAYRSVGKNLLNPFVNYPAGYTKEINGVTFTINDDGTITANGTASSNAVFELYGKWSEPNVFLDLDIIKTYQLRNFGIENENVVVFLRSLKNNTYTSHNSNNFSSRVLNNVEKITYFSVQVNSGTTVNNYVFKPQLEEDVATDFEPYQEILVPIDLKGNFVGKLPNGVADNLLYKDRHIYLEKNVGKVVLDGSEEIIYNTVNKVFAIVDLIDYKFASFIPLCNYYIGQSSVTAYNQVGEKCISCLNPSVSRILIKDSDYTTVKDFKTFLSENKPEVYYLLATPELIDLGEYDLSTLQGTNNITLLANLEPTEMNLTYALDIKKYIDKKVQ